MSFIEKLSNRSEGRRTGKGRREFLALKDEIEDALRNGYTIKEIWEFLQEEGMLSIKYSSFYYHVRLYGLRQKDLDARLSGASDSSLKQRNKDRKLVPNKTDKSDKPKNETMGFSYNAKPRKEDLV